MSHAEVIDYLVRSRTLTKEAGNGATWAANELGYMVETLAAEVIKLQGQTNGQKTEE